MLVESASLGEEDVHQKASKWGESRLEAHEFTQRRRITLTLTLIEAHEFTEEEEEAFVDQKEKRVRDRSKGEKG